MHISIKGKRIELRFTVGRLVEVERELGVKSFEDWDSRLKSLSLADLVKLCVVGCGGEVSESDVLADPELKPSELAVAVAKALGEAFSVEGERSSKGFFSQT